MENEMEMQELIVEQNSPAEEPVTKAGKVSGIIMMVIFGVTIAALATGVGFIFWRLLGVLK